MIERTPGLDIATHIILAIGLIVLAVPLYLVFVAATKTLPEVNTLPPTYWPSDQLLQNLVDAWTKSDFGTKFTNSLILALGVVTGKIVIAAITAFGLVFFDYRLKVVAFWLVFITLMLPFEVRIVPIYAVAANALQPFQALLDFSGM